MNGIPGAKEVGGTKAGDRDTERLKQILAYDVDALTALTFEQLSADILVVKGAFERQKAVAGEAAELAKQEATVQREIAGTMERLKAAMARVLSTLGS
jgi:hypothetical protein